MTKLTRHRREMLELVQRGEYSLAGVQWYYRQHPVHGNSGPELARGHRGRTLRWLQREGLISAPDYDERRWGPAEVIPDSPIRSTRAAAREARTVLYRFFDRQDRLLYIGSTLDPAGRFSRHAAEQPWWSEVVTIKIEDVPSAKLIRREMDAIRSEVPLHNRLHNGPASSWTHRR